MRKLQTTQRAERRAAPGPARILSRDRTMISSDEGHHSS
jgi:hypothetical protein